MIVRKQKSSGLGWAISALLCRGNSIVQKVLISFLTRLNIGAGSSVVVSFM